MDPVDILAIAAHRDDVELTCGGTLVKAAGAAGYTKAIMWTVDTIDWRPLADGGPTALTIVTKIRSAAPGSIVLMHLGGFNTLDALPGIDLEASRQFVGSAQQQIEVAQRFSQG